MVSSASRTTTERPFRASSTAAERPLGPEPTTTVSYTLSARRSFMLSILPRSLPVPCDLHPNSEGHARRAEPAKARPASPRLRTFSHCRVEVLREAILSREWLQIEIHYGWHRAQDHYGLFRDARPCCAMRSRLGQFSGAR